jgi:hypothetical protein
VVWMGFLCKRGLLQLRLLLALEEMKSHLFFHSMYLYPLLNMVGYVWVLGVLIFAHFLVILGPILPCFSLRIGRFIFLTGFYTMWLRFPKPLSVHNLVQPTFSLWSRYTAIPLLLLSHFLFCLILIFWLL